MQIIKTNSPNVVKKAVKILKSGGLVVYPTETCYGIGVDATNQKAVDKLLAYKTFRQGKPLSIAVTNKDMASNYVTLNTSALNLYQKFLPGPLTVISKGQGKVAKGVESETKTLGIRIPDYPLVIDIVKLLKKPITATSANASYKKRPYSVGDILSNTSKKQQGLVDLVIDAGTLPKRPSSTVVDTTLDDPLVLRTGEVKSFELRGSPVGSELRRSSEPSVSLTTKSPLQTINLAKTLMLKHWNSLQKQPLVFLLIGDLGAGKTQFSKGIGEFLKIKSPITSPTYTIQKEYNYTRHQVKGKFIHLDTWRLTDLKELDDLKLSNYFKPKHVIAIEWADRALKPILKLAKAKKAKIITLKLLSSSVNPNSRTISFRTL